MTTMTEDLVTVLRAYERLWRRDATDVDVDKVLAPDFVAHTPAGEGTDLSEFRDHLRSAVGSLDDLDARFEPLAAHDSRIAAHATISATHSHEFLGIAPTGRRLTWREVHVFDIQGGRVVEHWMDAGLLAAVMQMTGTAVPDRAQPQEVVSGNHATFGAPDHNIPLAGYMEMVAAHDAAAVRDWATEDYLQHGPFGANVTRDEFEASNREVVWKALPDISIDLDLLLADGELMAARGRGHGTHTGIDMFGIPAAGMHVTFTETHVYRLRGAKVCEHWLQVDLLGLMNQLQAGPHEWE